MHQLWYAKVCMVLTFGFAGLNIHQFLTSYRQVARKIKEFKDIMAEAGNFGPLTFFDVVFYMLIPGVYLVILSKTTFETPLLLVLGGKFALTAVYGIWTQRKILADWRYTRQLHLVGKCDNFLNIAMSIAVVYLLLFPI